VVEGDSFARANVGQTWLAGLLTFWQTGCVPKAAKAQTRARDAPNSPTMAMSNSKKKPGDKPESPLTKILVALAVALLAGGSAPWWWNLIVPKQVAHEKRPVEQVFPPECSPEILKNQLFRSASDRAAVIKATASTMKEKLGQQQFECVSNLANVLLEQDGNNGHGLYFQGEAWRFKAMDDPKKSPLCRDRMREFFLRYIANERLLSQNERDGDGNICYDREKGYCKERTAWVNHLMAVDYRQWAEDAKDKKTKLVRLELAAKFLKVDLDFGGFDLVAPSAALKDTINEDFEKLGVRYPADL
jgi:hypothetical protein